jgi:hypothetical protein
MKGKLIVKIIIALLCLYLLASLALSAAYHFAPDDSARAWSIVTHRCGLLLVAVGTNELWVFNPLSNYSDDYWFGIKTGYGLITYSEMADWNIPEKEGSI